MSGKEDKRHNASTWIFLGPSLSHDDAKSILCAHYAPPIKRGDLENAMRQGARLIGIIDGSFYRTFSVSPFEIVSALRKGVKVFGASSMGALKAVECEPFGMVGVGKIFEWYRSGKLEAEDEVAIVFDPDSLKALSVPLVNMRYAFFQAKEEGLITQKEKNLLLRIAKKIYFPERNYQRLFADAKSGGFPAGKLKKLEAFVNRDSCDLKALDAIACLNKIRETL